MSDAAPLNREEFYRGLDGLEKRLGDDIKGVNTRLDVLNGRTGRIEVEQGRVEQRVTGIEKETFQRPRRRAEEMHDARKGISKQEVTIATFALIVLTACVKLLMFFGNFLVDVAKAAMVKP